MENRGLSPVSTRRSYVEIFETRLPEDERRRGRRGVARRGKRAVDDGRLRAGEVDAGEGRQAARAALEALRAGRRRHVGREYQEVHGENGCRGSCRRRNVGRRAAEG